jgi:hypothetical protein
VWIALGKDDNYVKYHKMNSVGHPNDKADLFSNYLSVKGQVIEVDRDSCLCNACYVDAKKYATQDSSSPRWTTVHNAKPLLQKHCVVCHSADGKEPCRCEAVTKWIPFETWTHGYDYTRWKVYLEGHYNITITEECKHRSICVKHYMTVHNEWKSKKCVCCKEMGDNLHMVHTDVTVVKDYFIRTFQ